MDLKKILSDPGLWHALGRMGGSIAAGGGPRPNPVNPLVTLSQGFNAFNQGQREYEDIAYKQAMRKSKTDELRRMEEMRSKLQGVTDPKERASIIKSYYPRMEVRSVEQALNREHQSKRLDKRLAHESRERALSRAAAYQRHKERMNQREKQAGAGKATALQRNVSLISRIKGIPESEALDYLNRSKEVSDKQYFSDLYKSAVRDYGHTQAMEIARQGVEDRRRYFADPPALARDAVPWGWRETNRTPDRRDIMRDAKAAVAGGADKEAVRRRLVEKYGYTEEEARRALP